MVAWAPRLPPAVSGSGVRCGRVCWARVSAVPSPSWLGFPGVFFALLSFFFFLVSLSRALWSLSPHPLSFGLGCWLFFFFSSLCATPRHSWLGFAAGGGGRSPPLLAAVRWRRWCVVCGVLVGLWLVCGVVGPSPLLAVVPVCYSPPPLAGFRCRWWWALPATPGWGPLAAVVCGVWCVACGVWRWCVSGAVAGVWCGWSLATPGGGSCLLLPATPGWVSLPLVVGGPRHSWLGSAGGGAVWCVVCGGGVLVGLWLVCGVVGPSPLLAGVPVCCSPPLLAGFRCRWWWAVRAAPGWGPLAALVCGVWCVVCGGGVLVGLWLVCGVVGPSPLLAEVPVCYSPPLLAGFRCRRWWAVPAAPGWGPLAAVVCGVRCVACGVGVLVGLWLVCGVVGPSPLLAEVPVCYSPPLLAGFRCRWWWAVPATPGSGPLAVVVCGVWCVACGGGVWCVACGVWRWCAGGVVAGVCCGWSLATPGGGSCGLLPATPGWVSLPVVVGGPRHSWLGSAGGGGVWCVAVVCWWGCGWCVVWLVPRHSWRRFLCATPRHSWLGFAADVVPVVCETVSDHTLECRWCIAEAGGHNNPFEGPKLRAEGSFFNIFVMDSNLVEPTDKINL